jgi:hypothetical protein
MAESDSWEVAAAEEPLVVCSISIAPARPISAASFGEDGDDVGAAADLAVHALQRVRAAQLGPVLAGKA